MCAGETFCFNIFSAVGKRYLGLQDLTTLTNLAKECREIWHKDSVLFCHCAEFTLCGSIRRLSRDLFPEVC